MPNYMVDSSVWIDFFNKRKTNQVEKLKSLIPNTVTTGYIYLLPIIVQEILQGINDDYYFKVVQENLFGFRRLEPEPYELALESVDLYRMLRKKGQTIRKANDCIIAAACIEHKFTLIHNDKDFNSIAKHTSLKIYK